jgi:pullulanase/glycogen debranching enzyme
MKHPPGCQRIGNRSFFTLYAPYAKSVRLLLFRNCDDKKPLHSMPMRSVGEGWWEYSDIDAFQGLYYAYRIDAHTHLIADPYARALATFNDHGQEARAYIDHRPFNWEGDTFVPVGDPRDLTIYECHIRDLTAHPNSGIPELGSYLAAMERIDYLKKLGVNAVEFLPLMLFANHEPPYGVETEKAYNDWNPYAYNHWGYMTSFFFAPANIYAPGAKRKHNTWCDPRGEDVRTLKTLIKALHRAGIAVILDVVYNHISQYNRNPLRELAEDHYLRPHENHSGCGNDSNTESPIMRKLILDSVKYWMREYHVDGFRLDLAGILDDETLKGIRYEAKRLNPHAILVGEPWGKRYFPEHMSYLGLGIWNDRFRNLIKGENSADKSGFVFAGEDMDISPELIFSCLSGSLQQDGGLVQDSRYSVNYLESHDGYTLGDFIRIIMRENGKNALPDRRAHLQLNGEEEGMYRLCAFILACSQGIMMLHAGQEYARSKVIVKVPGVKDEHCGEMDPDSYAKDNETNYLDLGDVEINRDLYEYHRQLIAVRKHFPELRRSARESISPLYDKNNTCSAGYRIDENKRSIAVLLNVSHDKEAIFDLQSDSWQIFADLQRAACHALDDLADSRIRLSPRSALLLVKNKS